MKITYKKSLWVILMIFSIFFLTGLQVSFLNNFYWIFNIFLVLILFLVISKNIYFALFLGWFSGFLIDTVSFYPFGVNSLIFLILTAFLIIFQKKFLATVKTEGILIISAVAIFFYRFLAWLINSVLISKQEKFSLYFLNTGAAAELILTIILLLVIFSFINHPTFNAKGITIFDKKL